MPDGLIGARDLRIGLPQRFGRPDFRRPRPRRRRRPGLPREIGLMRGQVLGR